jgi:hypothetical protein
MDATEAGIERICRCSKRVCLRHDAKRRANMIKFDPDGRLGQDRQTVEF